MASQVDVAKRTFLATVPIPKHARVEWAAAGAVRLGTAGNASIGTARVDALAGNDELAVSLSNKEGTQKMIANAAIAEGVDVFNAADGKVAPAGTVRAGTSLSAADADGDIIEVLPRRSVSISIQPRIDTKVFQKRSK